ncbi:RNA polymerase sigma factor [Siphonobacter aquaeclarae]|uniref:RNA polymerase sigma factor, sigma-70 family n=1 Tax=Siphonobacter aquaeclarae TaxID=563176 RepID=A0A1G9YTB1_9BACT|nr:sigma-70 family RNA polymerase sigma factor [Siphonobacter aquaeclarae]MBO9638697.1 sigma-70 family RNA polymerase sigma factor [Siphonobacter aquaeclarae]SDN11741.1 RNA polymerase sigma factor, sigma-70 family [Siphonobacter aquaeclarae]
MESHSHLTSDQQLWNALLDGDSHAWGILYRRQYRPLRSWALRRFSDPSMVEDALQDLFLWIWQHRQNLNRNAPLAPYLKFSLRNQILKLLPGNHVPLNSDADTYEFSVEGCPESQWIEKESEGYWQHFAHKSVSSLPKRKRQVMEMRYHDGYSIEEICEKTGLRYQSVVNAVQLSVTQLREQAQLAGYNYQVFRRKSR